MSGYRGPWLRTVKIFNNEYFGRLVNDFNGNYFENTLPNDVVQWENSEKEIMMPADRAMILDTAMNVHVEAYANDRSLFDKDFSLAFQRLQELGIDLSASDYVNLKFESETCDPNEEEIAREIRFDSKYKLSYLVDPKESTIEFTVKTSYTGWVAFGFGNGMLSGIDGYIIERLADGGWSVDNIYT